MHVCMNVIHICMDISRFSYILHVSWYRCKNNKLHNIMISIDIYSLPLLVDVVKSLTFICQRSILISRCLTSLGRKVLVLIKQVAMWEGANMHGASSNFVHSHGGTKNSVPRTPFDWTKNATATDGCLNFAQILPFSEHVLVSSNYLFRKSMWFPCVQGAIFLVTGEEFNEWSRNI